MNRLALILALLLSSSLSWAQFTAVSGTVVDPNGLPYAYGTITPVLVTSGTPIFTASNQPYTPPTQSTGLYSNGSFLVQLADNTTLSPGGTQWNFTVCSAVGTVQPSVGQGPVCFTLAAPITISGASQNISANLQAAALALIRSGVSVPINVSSYPGADICVKAFNAGVANPSATLLMAISGKNSCSVDPRGGWISGFYTSAGASGPVFAGNLQVVPIAGTSPELDIDVPWIIGSGPNGRNTWTDIGGVKIVASANFRKNIAGPRCYTSDPTLVNNTGLEWDCANNISASNQVAITAGQGTNNKCVLVTLTTSAGGLNIGHLGGLGDPQVFRGGQIVNLINFGDALNDGPYRIIPDGDTNPCGGALPGSGGDYSKFYIYNPSAVSCVAGSCGAHLIITAESPMFYMHLRYWDMPTNSGTLTTQESCLDINGNEDDGSCISQGNKLLNLGEVDGIGYGIVGIDNGFGQEQVGVSSPNARTVMRTSMMSFGYFNAGNGSQNNAGFEGWEDYCGDPHDSTDCYSDGVHAPFGLYHVGVWLRDGWSRTAIKNVTFNSSAYAHIMIDGQQGFTGQQRIQDVHFQNTTKNQISGGSLGNAAGGNLCDIAIGFQSNAQGTYLEELQADATQGVLGNVCIAGTNHIPLTNMPAWSASQYFPKHGMIKPTNNNPSNYIMEVLSPVIGAQGGGSEPVWNGAGCTSYAVGATCGDGTHSLVWEIIGGNYPSDTGPANTAAGSSNNVQVVNTVEQSGDALNIFNGATGNVWNDVQITNYLYQNDSASIVEISSSHEHPWRTDQGIAIGSGFSVGNGGAVTATSINAPDFMLVGIAGSASVSNAWEVIICSAACTPTPLPPTLGTKLCVYNGVNVSSKITLAALGGVYQYENTAGTGYGTAGTGTFQSGGAVRDYVCIEGDGNNHYLTLTFNGTWTTS